jgi:hypothetical protein
MKLQAGETQVKTRLAGTVPDARLGRGSAAGRRVNGDAHREWAADVQQDESLVKPFT